MKTLIKRTLFIGLISITGLVQAAVVSNLLQDASFEALAGAAPANEPNDGGTPWNAVEAKAWIVAGRTDESHSGTQSVKVVNYNKGAIYQDTGLLIESNTVYEASAWILTGGAENVNQSDPPELTVSLYSTTNGNVAGPYVYQQGFFFDQTNTVNDTWEKFTGVLSSSDSKLQGLVGEYIQIRFIKKDSNDDGDTTSYELFIDDVEFGEYVPEPVAPGILLGYHSSKGPTPDFAAAGIDGTLFSSSFDGGIDSKNGSTDGTYGTLQGATILPSAYIVREGSTNTNSRVGVQIQNNTGDLIELDSISFDYGRWFDNGPQDIIVTYAYGDLDDANNTEVFSATNLAVTGASGNYHDFDVPLTNLNDVVLANGESATFHFTIDNAAGPWDKGAFDNIAILGYTAIDAWFVSAEPAETDQVKLTIYTSGNPDVFSLVGSDDLSGGSWNYVGHSDDGISPYVVTNLSHSTTDGTNRFIYVDAADAKNFYGLEY